MGLFRSNLPRCPADQHCSQWAKNYMKYCPCARKDWISLILGLLSVVSWGVAEVPQIITNYKEKSSEGLAVGLLLTWILGDLFNVFGCLLEPATLPTQYYTAVLYLVTTLALASQAAYYGYTSKRQAHKRIIIQNHDNAQEALIGRQFPPASETKTMLCVVFTMTIFLCTYNIQVEKSSYLSLNSKTQHNGIVIQVGRKLLQASGSLLEGSDGIRSIGIGTFLGWGMATIYIGGRLPQIFLNIRRGNVQGLNPLMFIFALVGNSAYVYSILVSSMEWSKINPNLPWVVEATGCVMLDTFILIQFVYFRHRKDKGLDIKHEDLEP
uniref:seven transmembrane protein 1-like n=1 Tax=Erigeron canadensis TaxID=72917 RepID=UPI001CB92169|nr:seven transmembrane protein 1-like [Erigeron canadensis]